MYRVTRRIVPPFENHDHSRVVDLQVTLELQQLDLVGLELAFVTIATFEFGGASFLRF
jgi:hypothetical protein